MHDKHELLFVQGAGENVHDAWDDKLVGSLGRALGDGFDIRYPRMPHEDDPSYASWKPVLEEQFRTLRHGAILVGHSVGATMLLRLLAEPVAVTRFAGLVFIAAPFLGDEGWSAGEFHFPRDLGTRLPQGVPIHFFHGLDDTTVPPSHTELYARAIPQARVHFLPGRDHQLNNELGEVAMAILSFQA